LKKFFALIFLGVAGTAAWLAAMVYLPLQPAGQKTVLLHPGWGVHRIAAELKSAGVIRSANAFIVWHRLHNRERLKAGEYLFSTSADTRDVLERIVRGDFLVRTVTVPEGYTMFDIADAVEQAGLGSREDFLKQAQSQTSLVEDFAPNAVSLEGYLFPDTYQFTRTQSMKDLVETMVRRFRKEASALNLANATPHNDTPLNDVPQLVTMASIVEKETGAPQERFLVASVYYNRLKKNIALDADPSVIYAHLLNGTYSGALHHSDMWINSPYNTYRYAGLPPGPIGNPGRLALEAAMHPATSDFYYFVSDGHGHHRFARSLREHNQNVDNYRRTVLHQTTPRPTALRRTVATRR
jgi:UPF0755 protein